MSRLSRSVVTGAGVAVLVVAIGFVCPTRQQAPTPAPQSAPTAAGLATLPAGGTNEQRVWMVQNPTR